MIRRLFIVALLPLVAVLGARIFLPGLAMWQLEVLVARADPSPFSVVALGITPALTAFLVVEFAALIVPPWRKLRRGGPYERAPLRLAALILMVVLATVQSYFIYQWLTAQRSFQIVESPGPAAALALIATLVAGTCLLVSLAWLNDRFGLGNGFSILIGWAALASLAEGLFALFRKLQQTDDIAPFDLFVMGLAAAGVVAVTARLLARSDGGLRAPMSGIAPFNLAASLLALPPSLARLTGWALPDWPSGSTPHSIALVVLVALGGWAFARLFTRSASPEARRQAVRRSVGWLLLLVALQLLPSRLKIPFTLDLVSLVVLTALTMDLRAEWRARRREPTLTAVWPIHQVALVEPARAALAGAGIFVHPRALHHRTLLQFFGPYVPVDLMVPAARAEEAQELLADLLSV